MCHLRGGTLPALVQGGPPLSSLPSFVELHALLQGSLLHIPASQELPAAHVQLCWLVRKSWWLQRPGVCLRGHSCGT